MVRGSKSFFSAFQKILRYRLAGNELNQIMDEALWEFETLAEDEEPNGDPHSHPVIRFSSVCIAFHRAMLRVGLSKDLALEATSEAASGTDWKAIPIGDASECVAARYFQSHDLMPLCEITLCRSCQRKSHGCFFSSRS